MFAATLTAVVCTILQNCRGDDAPVFREGLGGQWLTNQPQDFLHTPRFWRTPPTASGLRKLLSQIDVTAWVDALTRWITAVLPEEAPSSSLIPIALDGKSRRGTWNRWDCAVHRLNVVDQWTRTVIHQRVVPGDIHKHKVALVSRIDLVLSKGREEQAVPCFEVGLLGGGRSP